MDLAVAPGPYRFSKSLTVPNANVSACQVNPSIRWGNAVERQISAVAKAASSHRDEWLRPPHASGIMPVHHRLEGPTLRTSNSLRRTWCRRQCRCIVALFEDQDPDYRGAVLPPAITARVVVEQASNFGWVRYIGRIGAMTTMRTFDASAPLKELRTKFGFAPDHVVAARAQLQRRP
jgi:hypothetical protein